MDTPGKGFGLRSAAPIGRDDFVHEYIGEVINHDTFQRRMVQYREEGILHFYFMMLQRDEYIDATKKGARSRFMNHSCNPNCYVSKWHVGRHVRMGIFAKRDILAGEELTFNYNVDRYGNDAQPCYCGEPNCVGTLGGRTQTDVVTMDERFITALGIADEVAALRATLPRNRRTKILDEDFHPKLHAIDEPECARVVTAMRDATSNRKLTHMLLTRIELTDDVAVQKMIVKLHGFIVMAGVLDEWSDDIELVAQCLHCLGKWPLLARDKVVDSGVGEQVRRLAEGAPSDVQRRAASLTAAWDQLETTFRIARREQAATNEEAAAATGAARRRAEAAALPREAAAAEADDTSELRRSLLAYREADDVAKPPERPLERPPERRDEPPRKPAVSITEIIQRAREGGGARGRATEAAEEAAAAEERAAEARREAKRARRASSDNAERSKRPASAQERQPAKKRASAGERAERPREVDMAAVEKQLVKLVGALVVRQMSKVRGELDRDRFKRYAKDLTRVLCNKEMRNPKAWPPRGADGRIELRELSDEKRKKMKLFAHAYIKKVLQHRRERGEHTSAERGDSSVCEPDSGSEVGDVDLSMASAAADDGPDVNLGPDDGHDVAADGPSADSAPDGRPRDTPAADLFDEDAELVDYAEE